MKLLSYSVINFTDYNWGSLDWFYTSVSTKKYFLVYLLIFLLDEIGVRSLEEYLITTSWSQKKECKWLVSQTHFPFLVQMQYFICFLLFVFVPVKIENTIRSEVVNELSEQFDISIRVFFCLLDNSQIGERSLNDPSWNKMECDIKWENNFSIQYIIWVRPYASQPSCSCNTSLLQFLQIDFLESGTKC